MTVPLMAGGVGSRESKKRREKVKVVTLTERGKAWWNQTPLRLTEKFHLHAHKPVWHDRDIELNLVPSFTLNNARYLLFQTIKEWTMPLNTILTKEYFHNTTDQGGGAIFASPPPEN